MKRLADFAAETAAMSAGEFAAAFADPFLLLDPRKGKTDAGGVFRLLLPQSILAGVQESDLEGVKAEAGFNLVIKVAKTRDRRYPGLVTLGRGRENDIVVESPAVSKVHVLFRKDPKTGIFTIADSNSTNGTTLDGVYLTGSMHKEVGSGSQIIIGGAFRCTFNLPADLFDYMDVLRKTGKL